MSVSGTKKRLEELSKTMSKGPDMIKVEMPARKRIALVAHDARKPDLLAWVKYNRPILAEHSLFGTGTTGTLIRNETGLDVHTFMSGPLGGDQQVGAKIAEGDINFLIFFWDPLEPQPHDPDVKALLRLAVLYNIPTASNRATADFLITSNFMNASYDRYIPDYLERLKEIQEDRMEDVKEEWED